MDPRDSYLLEVVSNYYSLPKKERAVLKPLFDETIERHKSIMESHTIIEQGLKLHDINLQIIRINGE